MFPSQQDKERAVQLEKNYQIFKGEYGDVFRYFRNYEERKKNLEVITNLGGKITLSFADLIFLENPEITFKDTEEEIMKDIIYNNDLYSKLWQSAIYQSWGGLAVFELVMQDNKAKLNLLSPDIVFPQYNAMDSSVLDSVIIAWNITIEKKKYIFKKEHTIGLITYELYEVDTFTSELKKRVPLDIVDANMPEQELTGIDYIPIFFAKNPRDPKNEYGESDYEQIKTLLEELTRVNSQIATQLKKHANAKMAVPPGVLDKNGEVIAENFEMIEVSSTDEDGIKIPQYITNGNSLIDSAFRQKDEIIKDISRISEFSTVLLDADFKGGVEKLESLRLRILPTLAKVKRKQKAYTKMITNMLSRAYEWQTNKPCDKMSISIQYNDGLPRDELREVEIQSARIASGIQTKRDAIMILDNIDGEALDEKMSELDRDNTPSFSFNETVV